MAAGDTTNQPGTTQPVNTRQVAGPTAKQAQLSAGSKTIEAAITAVTSGLDSLTAKLTSVATSLSEVQKAAEATAITATENRTQQVKNAGAEEIRNKKLADKIETIWSNSLKDVVAAAKSLKDTIATTPTRPTPAPTTPTPPPTQQPSSVAPPATLTPTAAPPTTVVPPVAPPASIVPSAPNLDEDGRRRKEEAEHTLALSSQAKAAAKHASEMKALEVKQAKLKYSDLDALHKESVTQHTQANAALEKASEELDTFAQAVLKNPTDVAAELKLKEAKKAFENLSAKVSTARDSVDKHRQALDSHATAYTSVSKKVKEFAASLTVGAAVGQLYGEMQTAKTTGNYSDFKGFLGGQFQALKMGISSRAYNEINAQTRGASLTTKSQEEFDNQLDVATGKLTTITASREEGARLAATLYQTGASIGITADAMSGEMDTLKSNFETLSKITGKSAADMAQLTLSIAQDVDHRATMLGLAPKERVQYLAKMANDVKALEIQGYTIEQAKEFQNLAQQRKLQSIQERVSKRAKTSQAGQLLINQMQPGNQRDAAAAALAEAEKTKGQLRTGKFTGEARTALENKQAMQEQQFWDIVKANENTQSRTDTESAFFTTWMKNYEESSGVGKQTANNRKLADEKAEADRQTRLKEKEKSPGMGEAGSGVALVTDIVGYVTGLTGNTSALLLATTAIWALNKTMGGKLLPDFSDLPSRAKTVADTAKGKIGTVKTATKAVAGAALPALAMYGLANAADWGVGKLGIGKDKQGNDKQVDSKQDDSNWAKMSIWEKTQSIIPRGIEQAGSFVGLDNLSREAAIGRINTETEYLNKQAAIQPKTATPVAAPTAAVAPSATTKLADKAATPPPAPSTSAQSKPALGDASNPQSTTPDATITQKTEAALNSLEKLFYETGIAFFKASNPANDLALREKQLATLRQEFSLQSLKGATFNQPPSVIAG